MIRINCSRYKNIPVSAISVADWDIICDMIEEDLSAKLEDNGYQIREDGTDINLGVDRTGSTCKLYVYVGFDNIGCQQVNTNLAITTVPIDPELKANNIASACDISTIVAKLYSSIVKKMNSQSQAAVKKTLRTYIRQALATYGIYIKARHEDAVGGLNPEIDIYPTSIDPGKEVSVWIHGILSSEYNNGIYAHDFPITSVATEANIRALAEQIAREVKDGLEDGTMSIEE